MLCELGAVMHISPEQNILGRWRALREHWDLCAPTLQTGRQWVLNRCPQKHHNLKSKAPPGPVQFLGPGSLALSSSSHRAELCSECV